MTRTLKANLDDLVFPKTCVVCGQPASQSYTLMKTFSYGRRTVTVKLPVPMCATHHTQANSRSPAERRVGQMGLLIGALIGIVSAVVLALYWARTGQSLNGGTLLLAGVVGIGLFLAVWMAALLWIAPRWAYPDAKLARNAIKLGHYWPAQKLVQLEFANGQVADQLAKILAAQGKRIET